MANVGPLERIAQTASPNEKAPSAAGTSHALARTERGLFGILHLEGPPNPEIYNGHAMTGMDH